MGQPKLLLPWGATSVLGHLIAQWNRLGASQITVVCAADDAAMHAELENRGFPAKNLIYNSDPDRGMFSSIQCAANWPGWYRILTHWAIVLGDQPHLRESTLQAILAASAAHPEKICQPTHGGHRCHPVVLPGNAFSQLAETKVATLKEFLAAAHDQVALFDVADAGLALDIDKPEDYEKALQIAREEPL
jgi:molybdenum cofactor cytidylyltransferase